MPCLQTYAEADRDNDGLLDPVEFQYFIQQATQQKDATVEDARALLLAVTRKAEGPINFMQVMNSWHLIGGDINGSPFGSFIAFTLALLAKYFCSVLPFRCSLFGLRQPMRLLLACYLDSVVIWFVSHGLAEETPADSFSGAMGGAAALRQLRRSTVASIDSPPAGGSPAPVNVAAPKEFSSPAKAASAVGITATYTTTTTIEPKRPSSVALPGGIAAVQQATSSSTGSSPRSPTSPATNSPRSEDARRVEIAAMEQRLGNLRTEVRKSELEASSKQEYLRNLETRLADATKKLQQKEDDLSKLNHGAPDAPVSAENAAAKDNGNTSDEEESQRLDATLGLKKREIKMLEDKLIAVEEQLAQKLERKEQIETMMKRLLERLLEKEAQLVKVEKHFEETRVALKKEVAKNEANIRKLQKKVLSLAERDSVAQNASSSGALMPENSSGSSLASAGSDLASQVVDSKLSSSNKKIRLSTHEKQRSRDSGSSTEDTRSSEEDPKHGSSHQRRESKSATAERTVTIKDKETIDKEARKSIGGEKDKPKKDVRKVLPPAPSFCVLIFLCPRRNLLDQENTVARSHFQASSARRCQRRPRARLRPQLLKRRRQVPRHHLQHLNPLKRRLV